MRAAPIRPICMPSPTQATNDTLTLPLTALPPLDLSQLPADDGPGLAQRLMEMSGIVADPMLPKAQWLMHNASGWDWFLGFSYVSLSFIRDLDYLVASALFPGFGVAFQAARTGAAWGGALRDDEGYENAIIQTALLSVGAFGLYLAKLPPGSVRGPASARVTSSGTMVMASSAVNVDVLGRALVIATQLGHVLFAKDYSPRKPEDLFGRVGRTRTIPTGSQGGKPTGTPDRNPNANPQTLRGLEIEEHSAELLAERGYRVHQQPGKLLNGKEPDYWIEDTIFDNIAPEVSDPNKIWVGVKDKILKEQTRRVIINLERSDVVVDDELLTIFKEYPIDDLDEVILITKEQDIIQLYP